jgi:two-component sensor histidine kinase
MAESRAAYERSIVTVLNPPGLGHSLIEVLTKQLDGEALWSSEGRGTTLTLEFPIRVA